VGGLGVDFADRPGLYERINPVERRKPEDHVEGAAHERSFAEQIGDEVRAGQADQPDVT